MYVEKNQRLQIDNSLLGIVYCQQRKVEHFLVVSEKREYTLFWTKSHLLVISEDLDFTRGIEKQFATNEKLL